MAFRKVCPVGSKAVTEIAFDPDDSALRVRFASGKTYQARGVDPLDALGLTYAASRGKFYSDVLRGKYEWEEVSSTLMPLRGEVG